MAETNENQDQGERAPPVLMASLPRAPAVKESQLLSLINIDLP